MVNLKQKLTKKWQSKIRDKAISRAYTRITLAGKKPEDFEEDQLEIIVREEEDKLNSSAKEKSLFALAALFGLSLWG